MDMPLYAQPAFRQVAGDIWRPGGLSVTRRGLALCDFTPGARLVDIGCGAGESLRLLRALGYRAFGLDRHIDRQAASLPCLSASALALPLRSSSLDGLLCECVLSLLPDTAAALREMARVLRPAGRLLLSDLFLTEESPRAQDDLKRAAFQTEIAQGPAAHSCLQGARTLPELHLLFQDAGLHLLHHEDHSASLATLAAQFLWNDALPPPRLSQDVCTCPSRRHGYALWILEKRKATA